MKITLASLIDMDKIMDLTKNCIKDMETKGIYQWNEFYPTSEVFREDIKNNSLFIIKEQDECLGIISLNEEQSPEYKKIIWLNEAGKILVVHRLAVNSKYQRQGIGRQLMNFAEAYAVDRKYDSIRLDAYSGNPNALKLYEGRGYKKAGQVFFPQRELPFYCYEKLIRPECACAHD